MTVRLIPERTVDSMFAVEVIQLVPHALVWSPTNTKGRVDHEVHGLDVRALSFECKGTVTDQNRDPAKPWKSPIDYPQLHAYLQIGIPVFYVIPAKPSSPQYPWIRACEHDPDEQGMCLACHNPRDPGSRRWAGESQIVKSAEIHCRFQPWFAHWCWVIPAKELNRHLAANGRPTEIPTADDRLKSIPGADRLCHFLAGVQDGRHDLASIPLAPADLTARLSDLQSPRERFQGSSDESDATSLHFVFIPDAGRVA